MTDTQRRWLLFYCLSRMMGRDHDAAYHEAWSYLAKMLRKAREADAFLRESLMR